MDPAIRQRHDDDSIATAGGFADRATALGHHDVLWDDDDCVLACSAAAAIVPRALGYRGDLTDDAVALTGRAEMVYPVPAFTGPLAAR